MSLPNTRESSDAAGSRLDTVLLLKCFNPHAKQNVSEWVSQYKDPYWRMFAPEYLAGNIFVYFPNQFRQEVEEYLKSTPAELPFFMASIHSLESVRLRMRDLDDMTIIQGNDRGFIIIESTAE